MKKIAILFAATLMGLVACQKEQELVTETPSENTNIEESKEYVDFTFTAIRNADDDPTKVAISGANALWEVGDQIFLFAVRGTYQYKIGLSEALTAGDLVSGGASATFHFTVENPSTNYTLLTSTADYFFASYPYRALTSEEEVAEVPGYFTLSPSNNLFTYTMLAEQTNATVQNAFAKTADRSFTLSFQNLNTLLKFTTENTLATKAVLRRNDAGILGYTRVNINYNTGAMGYSAAWLTDDKISAIYSITKPVEAGDNYFAVWPNITMTDGFTIILYDDLDNELQSFVYASNFKPTKNHITTIANFDSRSTMTVKPQLLSGGDFNVAVKNMVDLANGGEGGMTTTLYDLRVTNFVVSTSDSGSYGEGVGCTKVSAVGSVFDIWATYSGGTVTLRTAADGIKMPTDASDFLEHFRALTSVSFLTGLDMTPVTDASRMLKGCVALESVPALTMNNVSFFTQMFQNCSGLTTLGKITGGNVTFLNYMFSGCANLTSVEFSDSFETYNCRNYENMFNGCSSLTSIVMKGFHIGIEANPTKDIASHLNGAMNGVSNCTIYYSALPDGAYTGENCWDLSANFATYGSSTSNLTWNTGRP